MDTDRKIVSLTSKLNRLTQEGVLKWRRMNPPEDLTVGTDEIVTKFYATEYEGRNLGIYEERYRDHGAPYWDNRPVLALFTKNWQKEWEFPQVAGTWELMRSVEYQLADVDSFITKILGEKHEEM